MPKPFKLHEFTVGTMLHEKAILMDYYKLCHNGDVATDLKAAELWLQNILRDEDYWSYNLDDWNDFFGKTRDERAS